jgi:hypothetical protein
MKVPNPSHLVVAVTTGVLGLGDVGGEHDDPGVAMGDQEEERSVDPYLDCGESSVGHRAGPERRGGSAFDPGLVDP